jgi:SAM-dependent methyltransferase
MTAGLDASTAPAIVATYDEVPYPGHPYAQTHPDRLATHALLYGLEPPPLAHARVLELGCGDGTNLIAMAVGMPDAQFVGIDAAVGAITDGRLLVERLELTNVELSATTFDDFRMPAGSFDYVVAHGVYSWIPGPARDRLLALCRTALAENGVAYVSYNALPGGRLLQALRDMLRVHTEGLADPTDKVAQARALLRLLLDTWPADHAFAAAMREHAERLLARTDAALVHDDLAAVNDPVLFSDFVAHAARHGLQFLAEADFFEMQDGVLPDGAADELRRIDDPLAREQYADFVKGRMFRQTLLCRAELAVDRAARPSALERLAVSSRAQGDPAADADGRRRFTSPLGATLTTDHPAVIAILEQAADAWPAALPIGDLLPSHLDDQERRLACDSLLRCYAATMVELHVRPPALVTSVSSRPAASPLARDQARTTDLVTSLRHSTVHLTDAVGRELLTLLDGSRDRDAIARDLRRYLDETGGDVPPDFDERLDRGIDALARLGLLAS